MEGTREQNNLKLIYQESVSKDKARFSLGVLVDGQAVDDGPNPADEEPAGQNLEDSNDDGGFCGVSLSKDTSNDGAPAG